MAVWAACGECNIPDDQQLMPYKVGKLWLFGLPVVSGNIPGYLMLYKVGKLWVFGLPVVNIIFLVTGTFNYTKWFKMWLHGLSMVSGDTPCYLMVQKRG